MTGLQDRAELVERWCARDDLSTYDPYDIWKTRAGFAVKDLYNRHRALGLVPAAALTLFDTYLNDRHRWFYRPQEYPIVRAWAALALLNLHARAPAPRFLAAARRHLDWLLAHASPGYSGPCWGIAFRQPISAGLIYEADLPLATMTPYPLEAFVRYHATTGDGALPPVIRGIHAFLDRDVPLMEDTVDYQVPAYSARRDRRVVNVASYMLHSLALVLPYLDPGAEAGARHRIRKLHRYLEREQRADGSWLYSPDGPPFIDCFHTCIVLKNLVRAGRLVDLPGVDTLVARGWDYVLREFRDPDAGLFRRFALANKPSLVRFDLYDNAEVMNLALLLGDVPLASGLAATVLRAFGEDGAMYSQIDRFGRRHHRNTLRWAVMPWLHALSLLPD
jgi:hypothetical protein